MRTMQSYAMRTKQIFPSLTLFPPFLPISRQREP